MNVITQLRFWASGNRDLSRCLILDRKGEKLLMRVGVLLANSCFLLCVCVCGGGDTGIQIWLDEH